MAEPCDLLIVDDETELVTVISEIMSGADITYDTAADGIEAIKKLKERKFLAALCDISMPKMDGMELLVEVKRLGIDTTFIFLTGNVQKETVLQALRMGAIDYVAKPFDNEELLLQVSRAIEIGRRRQNIEQILSSSVISEKDRQRLQKDKEMVNLILANNGKKRVG